jgi:hypothetical protein
MAKLQGDETVKALALPHQASSVAKKLVKMTKVPDYFTAGRRATEKFVDKHPVEVTDDPENAPELNNKIFNASNIGKDKSRKADRTPDQEEKVYESAALAKFKKILKEGGQEDATSDSPGANSGENQGPSSPDNNPENAKPTASVPTDPSGIRNYLEQIALGAAEIYEKIQDTTQIPQDIASNLSQCLDVVNQLKGVVDGTGLGSEGAPKGNQPAPGGGPMDQNAQGDQDASKGDAKPFGQDQDQDQEQDQEGQDQEQEGGDEEGGEGKPPFGKDKKKPKKKDEKGPPTKDGGDKKPFPVKESSSLLAKLLEGKRYEGSKEDKREDAVHAAQHHMSTDEWEQSPGDKLADAEGQARLDKKDHKKPSVELIKRIKKGK